MLPPGLGFNALSDKALVASRSARMPRSYWDWQEMLKSNAGVSSRTPPRQTCSTDFASRFECFRKRDCLKSSHATPGTRRPPEQRSVAEAGALAARPGGVLQFLTAVVMPEGHDSDRFRAAALQGWDISLGAGLGKLQGRIFRVGHLGDFNDLMLMGTLAGVELGSVPRGFPSQRRDCPRPSTSFLAHKPSPSLRGVPPAPDSGPSRGERSNARMKRRLFTAPGTVVLLLCLMYLITYVDRTNMSTAGPLMRKSLGLSLTQLGLVFSAFGYPYAVFQIIGGHLGTASALGGPSRCAGWCGQSPPILTGLAGGLVSSSWFACFWVSAKARPFPPRHGRCSTGWPRTGGGGRRA